MKKLATGLLLVLISAVSADALAGSVSDTYENRLAAAQRYLDVVPMRDMLRDTVKESAKTLPEKSQQAYVDVMTNTIRVDTLESAVLASMIKHFTAGELDALAAFYGSKEGKAAVSKLGAYMADVMPVIQEEIVRAQQQLVGSSWNFSR
jgi:hypothetical protein